MSASASVYFCLYFHHSHRWIQKDFDLFQRVIYFRECSACFPLSFMVSSLTFRSLIPFEFVFMYGIREYSHFILFHGAVQFSQHHLLEYLFSTVYSCLLCHRFGDHRCVECSRHQHSQWGRTYPRCP